VDELTKVSLSLCSSLTQTANYLTDVGHVFYSMFLMFLFQLRYNYSINHTALYKYVAYVGRAVKTNRHQRQLDYIGFHLFENRIPLTLVTCLPLHKCQKAVKGEISGPK